MPAFPFRFVVLLLLERGGSRASDTQRFLFLFYFKLGLMHSSFGVVDFQNNGMRTITDEVHGFDEYLNRSNS